jgi:hypothetical protein
MLLLSAGLALGGAAQGQTLTAVELKAELAASKAMAKFLKADAKCISKCALAAFRNGTPQADCLAPYADPTASACIYDPVKGAWGKLRAALLKAGKVDCPECYAGGDCALYADQVASTIQGQVDSVAPGMACADPPTETEGRCELGVMKAATKLLDGHVKCYGKCFQAAFKAGDPTGSACQPPSSDAETATCLTTVDAKSIAFIQKACTGSGTYPACYSGSEAASWVNLMALGLDGNVPSTFCGD